MGLCQSEEERMLQTKSHEIDRKINEGRVGGDRTIKLLLLGTGECGKSTVLKQMRILHNHGFSDVELIQQKSIVYNNTVQAMATLLNAMATLKIEFTNPKRENDAKVVLDVVKSGTESEPINAELAMALKNLWSDPAVSITTFERRNEFQINESAKFFLDNLSRICESNYRPSEQDVLHTRIKTTGIVEVKFRMKNVDFVVFDVGGQRSERKKWIHCFENINALIFIVAVSEYDQLLLEDESTNRIVESMRLFESICNSRWFINTSMILFLNKKDLFAEKIKTTSINVAFDEYPGPQTYDDSIDYIRLKFEDLNANPKKTIFVHQTCATDTNQVQIILDSVITTIIQANLHKSGLY